MIPSLTLPPDLAPEERATVEAYREKAVREAEERAAVVVRVDREVKRLTARGLPVKAAFCKVFDDGLVPLSPASIEDAYRRRKAWAV